ncbi:hypothetical protein NNC19_05485 [Clostridium sp. SHJSY1]|uniref:hypothetical protein n=1 Tax=Clostridium sp. SHJSY1 TaxID=2942483 RepID=UPI0028748308|nr:hypothetical protein [Clostridium sp. SHJSY1]MDS0525126.1 hypothetical protein [Clostridium sp. SHJSY1]
MKLYINVKQAGSRKNFITKEEIILDVIPETLRELIGKIVTKNVEEFNENLKKERIVDYLTGQQIEGKANEGKVSFGTIYNEDTQDLNKAIDTALLAYEDGLYKVFVGDEETECLDSPLIAKNEDVLTFIKLTMLSGRLW